MATLAQEPAHGFSFWQKMALGIALFIVFGFAQFAARGFVDLGAAPAWLHLHGAVMLSWLALLVVQPTLIAGGPRMNTMEDTLGVVSGAMQAGASGVVFGRNIWQSKNPAGMVRALQSIIHKRSSVAEAME